MRGHARLSVSEAASPVCCPPSALLLLFFVYIYVRRSENFFVYLGVSLMRSPRGRTRSLSFLCAFWGNSYQLMLSEWIIFLRRRLFSYSLYPPLILTPAWKHLSATQVVLRGHRPMASPPLLSPSLPSSPFPSSSLPSPPIPSLSSSSPSPRHPPFSFLVFVVIIFHGLPFPFLLLTDLFSLSSLGRPPDHDFSSLCGIHD